MVRKRGFTLVELLVVIAIMAVLLTLLTPALQKARIQAKSTLCKGHLHGTGNLFITYAAEYDGNFPEHHNVWPDYVRDWRYPESNDMRELVRKYEEVDPEFYYCPLNFPYEMSPDWITVPGTPGSGWGGWNTDETSINIGYDWFINFSVPSGSPEMQFFNGFRITKTMSQAREDIAVACDSLRVHKSMGPAANPDQDLYNWEFRKMYDLPGEYTGAWYVYGVWQGHQWAAGGINVLYGDGHVEFNGWNGSNMKARADISGGIFYN